MTGTFIVIEGTDGSGKNTQRQLLEQRLREEGQLVESISFPRYETPTGRVIGECYLGKGKDAKSFWRDPGSEDPDVISLYYAADRLAAKPLMTQWLKDGKIVICDRYVESNMAHQGGKFDGEKRWRTIANIEALEYGHLQLPKPDKVIFLYVPFEVSSKNRQVRRITDAHERDENHMRRAEEAYLELALRYQWAKIDCTRNGEMLPVESIHEQIYALVKCR